MLSDPQTRGQVFDTSEETKERIRKKDEAKVSLAPAQVKPGLEPVA